MTPRQEKAPLTQQAVTVRTLTLGSAVVAAVAATAITGGALRLMLARFLARK